MPTQPNDDPEDWADRLALEIALDMQRMGTRDACKLTAARLRLVKSEGALIGGENMAAAVGVVL